METSEISYPLTHLLYLCRNTSSCNVTAIKGNTVAVEETVNPYPMIPIFPSQAGTFESSDLIVLIEPKADHSGRKIEIESIVMLQYGDNLKAIVTEMLDQYQIEDVHIILKDKGALEPVVRARMETAILRSLEHQNQ